MSGKEGNVKCLEIVDITEKIYLCNFTKFMILVAKCRYIFNFTFIWIMADFYLRKRNSLKGKRGLENLSLMEILLRHTWWNERKDELQMKSNFGVYKGMQEYDRLIKNLDILKSPTLFLSFKNLFHDLFFYINHLL